MPSRAVSAPTPATVAPTLAPRIALYRWLAGFALVGLGSAAVAFAERLPWLGALSMLAGVAAGKYFGVPHAEVIKLGLQLMTPEKAVAVTVEALRSLPPAAAETLLASLPPPAANGSRSPAAVRFIGTTEPPEPLEPDEPTRPSRPAR